jgi:4-diphosphocytidyl-2-C-methyl-D-erythritol kinase
VIITLHKRIWRTAGLGGGSSDAGAVLRLLQRATAAFSPAAIGELALQLGADVPYFLDPFPARIRGVGEQIERIRHTAPLHLLLLNPDRPLATTDVFAQYRRHGRFSPEVEIPTEAIDLARAPGLIHNDLEPFARQLEPQIWNLSRIITDLGALGVGMSGSGPTVFGLFPNQASAQAALGKVQKSNGFLAICTQTLVP